MWALLKPLLGLPLIWPCTATCNHRSPGRFVWGIAFPRSSLFLSDSHYEVIEQGSDSQADIETLDCFLLTKTHLASALGGETAILSNKSGDDFRCLYHVGTRLEDLENTISPPKSLVPFLPYRPY